MSLNARRELRDYMATRNAWVTPEGKMRATISYDTSIMIFKNLTSRFNHVKPLGEQQQKLMKRIRG